MACMTIVPFYLLDSSFMKQFVTLRLEKLARLLESHRMVLTCSDKKRNAPASRSHRQLQAT